MAELSHYRGIPKSVRVGCYEFRIEVHEADDAEADGAFGHMNPISQKIRLRPGMTPQNLANTLLHEIMHAIHWFHACNPDCSADIEEEYTLKGTNGLCAFWQDNPKTMTWIGSLLTNKGASK